MKKPSKKPPKKASKTPKNRAAHPTEEAFDSPDTSIAENSVSDWFRNYHDRVSRTYCDEYWREFEWESKAQQDALVIGEYHWTCVLPGMDVPANAKGKFLREFLKPEAMRNRLKALRGLTWTNWNTERILVDEARSVYKGASEWDSNENNTGLRFDAELLGFKFATLICSGGRQACDRLVRFLKEEEKSLPPGEQKGGMYSNNGQMLRAFIDLHIASKGFPEKSSLRERSFLNHQDAHDSLKEMGLLGLP